jgi:putative transposase
MKENEMKLNLEKFDKLIDEAMKERQAPMDETALTGVMKQMMKRVVERMLQGELTHHLGYEKHDPAGHGSGNSRNGASSKTIKGELGEVMIEVPRDRNGDFEPQLLGKHQTRFTGFDEKIVSMYARGMSTRDIQAHIREMYGAEVSAALVSEVTDGVLEEVKTWQNRPLEPLYAVIYLDALFVKIRHNGRVENRAVFVAIGIDWSGKKDVLGLWTSPTEGAKFWLAVLTEIKNRGVKDVLIFCVDGLKGFPEAIESVFPQADVQQCIVHAVRASLNYVNWKERKLVAADLKPIYRAATEAQARVELVQFKVKWGSKYQPIVNLWENNWERLTPFFAFPEEIRKIIYTTNAVESLHSTMRKIIKTRGSFPNEEAALKLMYLALQNVVAKWDTIQHWKGAMNRFQILAGDRIRAALGA